MADQNYANNELQAANGLAYLGVRATQPPNFHRIKRAPTKDDIEGYRIGDMWLDISPLSADPPVALTTANVWQLLSKNGVKAQWVNFIGSTTNGVMQIEGDVGGAIDPNGAGVFFFAGNGSGLQFDGSILANTQAITGTLLVGSGGTGSTSLDGILIGDGTNPVVGAVPTDHHVLLGDAATYLGQVATIGTAGQVLTSNGAGMDPSWETVSAAGSVMHFIVSNGTSPVDPDAGNIILKDGANITISGQLVEANGITFAVSGTTDHAVQLGNATGSLTSLANGTTGQVLTANAGADPTWEDAASALLTFTMLDNTDSTYTVIASDQFLLCNVGAGTLRIDLPNSTTTGRVIYIKDQFGDAATNNITVTTPGGVTSIDGVTSYAMNTAHQSITIVWNGSSYSII